MEKDKDIIEIIADEPAEAADKAAITERIVNYFKGLPSCMSPLFIKVSCAVCAAALAASAAAGFLVPHSEKSVLSKTAALREKDSVYLDAKRRNDETKEEIDKLTQKLAEDEENLEKFNQSQDNLDKISQKNDELQSEKESLEARLEQKQRELNNLESSLESKTKRTVTLTSGRYTVGENIASGSYNVTGSGSIVISGGGKARVNKSLKSEGETYAVSDGEIIEIDGSAKFTPS